jgi:DNA-binding GntR family transcriptional regulator
MANDSDTSATVNGHRVADELRQLILDGEFQPGARIGQEMLAERFMASRMPVRDALRQLEAEGLVSIVPHSGAWVSKLDPFEFEQTYKLREVIEPLAIQESIPHLTGEQIEHLGALADEIVATCNGSPEVEAFLRLDREFHLLTYSGVQYGHLSELVLRMWNTTQPYRRALVSNMTTLELEATNADHFLIVDSVRRGDAESAAAMVRLHIRRTRRVLESAKQMS